MGNSAVPKIDIQPELTVLLQNTLETVPQKLETFSSLLMKLKADPSLSFFRNVEAVQLFERNPSNFKSLFIFCVDLLSKEADQNQEADPLLVGAIIALTRMVPLLIEESKSEERKEGESRGEELLWKTRSKEEGPPLIVKLVECVTVLMFKPGFAVDVDPTSNFNKCRSMTGINEKLIWKRGIRLEKVSKKQQYIYDQNRCLLVRLAIVVLSEPIYYSPQERKGGISPLIALMTCKISRNSKNIFFSLINSCFNYDCDGLKIPYLSAIQRHMHQQKLAELSAQLLNVLLSGKAPSSKEELDMLVTDERSHWRDIYEYFIQEISHNNKEMHLKSSDSRRPSVLKSLFVPKALTGDIVEEEDQTTKKDEDQAEIPDPRQIVKPKVENIQEQRSPVAGNVEEDMEQSVVEDDVPHIFNSHAQAQTKDDLSKWMLVNEYVRILTIFESEHDFSVIVNGIVKLLSNSQRVENTTLPHSVRAIHFHEEMLLLLWRMITTSNKFALYIVKHPKLNKLVQSVIFHLHKGKAQPRKANTLYLSIFILFYLSQIDIFGRNLNIPYSDSVHLEGMPPVQGSLGDLIIVSLGKALSKAPAQLASLNKIISGLICNIAPHLRFLSASASGSLIQMVEIFSSNNSTQALRTVLDAIDFNLYYQNKRNYNLILSVYQAPQVWKSLQTKSQTQSVPAPKKEQAGVQDLEAAEPGQEKKEAWVDQSSPEIKKEQEKEEDPPSQQEPEPKAPSTLDSLRNVIVAANTMAQFISKEKISTRSGILKIMKQQKFSLLSERNQREIDEMLKHSPRGLNSLDEPARDHRSSIKEINTNNQLLRRDIYIVRYESNPLIENWLESFVWSVIFTQHFETKLFRPQKVKLFYVEIKDQ